MSGPKPQRPGQGGQDHQDNEDSQGGQGRPKRPRQPRRPRRARRPRRPRRRSRSRRRPERRRKRRRRHEAGDQGTGKGRAERRRFPGARPRRSRRPVISRTRRGRRGRGTGRRSCRPPSRRQRRRPWFPDGDDSGRQAGPAPESLTGDGGSGGGQRSPDLSDFRDRAPARVDGPRDGVVLRVPRGHGRRRAGCSATCPSPASAIHHPDGPARWSTRGSRGPSWSWPSIRRGGGRSWPFPVSSAQRRQTPGAGRPALPPAEEKDWHNLLKTTNSG